jgi:hypothetical protein
MAMARKMSDGQLAEVLQGKSLSVPQYVAMTEAMGRKSLRTAMQGQQAMAQAQQPSVKDKLLMGDQPQMQGIQQGMPQMSQQPVMAAEGGMMYADGGIADLPAPNMESMDMASGGIVAFQDNPNQPVREGMPSFAEGSETDKKILEFLKSAPGALVNKFKELNQPYSQVKPFEGTQAEFDAMVQRGKMPKRTVAETAVNIKDEEKRKKELDDIARGQGVFPEGSPALPNAIVPQTADKPPSAPKLPPAVIPGAPTADKEKAGLGATDEFKSYMDMVKKNNADYLSKLEGLSTKQREGLAKLRSQSGGEALINLAQGLLSKPGLAAGVAAGLPGVAATSAASRKEQRAIEQGANEMDFNLAKAQQAAAKGDMESALMFKKMADEASYRTKSLALQTAQLNKEPDMLRTLRGIAGDPRLEAIYGKTGKTDVLDREAAAKLWKDLSKSEKRTKYGDDFELYYTTMNNRLLSATIPGQGANVIGSIK